MIGYPAALYAAAAAAPSDASVTDVTPSLFLNVPVTVNSVPWNVNSSPYSFVWSFAVIVIATLLIVRTPGTYVMS